MLMRLTDLIFTAQRPKPRGLDTSYVENTAYRHRERMKKANMETGLTAPSGPCPFQAPLLDERQQCRLT